MSKKEHCRYIAPPEDWKEKVVKGQGWDVRVIESRAEKAIDELQSDYLDQARADLAEIDRAIERAKSGPKGGLDEALREVHRIAHEMRGQAGTFGYRLITQIGTSLCNYIEAAEDMDSVQLQAIEIHADAMRAVISQNIVGEGGATGKEFLAGMQDLVAKTLNK